MSRVVGPLHSDDASGAYGGFKCGMCFGAWGNKRYVRGLGFRPMENPRTVAQLRNRQTVAVSGALWDTFNSSQKEYWAEYGVMFGLPGWQAFVQYNLNQAQQGWTAQMEANAEHLETPDAPVDMDAEVVDNAMIVTWTDVAAPYTTGMHCGTSAGFTPAMSNLIVARTSVDGAERQATVLIAPGTYYLKARGGGQDGGVGTPSVGVGPLVIA